jgi:PadR family transcriptional regulator AphA
VLYVAPTVFTLTISMSTRHAILQVLSARPATGYDIARHAAISTEPVWSATHSQIYPTLHKLEAEGLVESESTIRGRRMLRFVYSITDEGRRELAEWIERPVQYLPVRDPFRLWAARIDSCSREAALSNVDAHIRIHAERAGRYEQIAAQLASGEHPLIQARVGRVTPDDLDRIKRARSAIYAELAELSRFEIESAKRIRKVVEELHADDIRERQRSHAGAVR